MNPREGECVKDHVVVPSIKPPQCVCLIQRNLNVAQESD